MASPKSCGCTLSQIARWTAATPAALAGLSAHTGAIAPGMDANLVAFDPDAHLTVTPEILHYRHKISPYLGQTLRGVVRSTWLRGERIFTRSEAGDIFASASTFS